MASEVSPIDLPLWYEADDEQNDTNLADDAPRSPERTSSMMSGVSGLFGKGVKSITNAMSKSYRNVPAGLGNWDNSCYQNSVIQGLASLPSLREYLSKNTSEHSSLDADSTNGALLDLITKLNDPQNHGQSFWIRGALKSMSTFQQQDAQEYYSKILDALDKEIQSATSKRRSSASWVSTVKGLSGLLDVTEKGESVADQGEENTAAPEQPIITPNPLDGLLAQRVGCINCGYTEGLSLIPFNCITVPLGSERWRSYDIGQCLDEYTSLEYIEGVECAKCTLLKMKDTLSNMKSPVFADRLQAVEEALEEEKFDDKTVLQVCKVLKKNWVKSTKSRQAVIARAPKSLVIHVNRSIFNEMTGDQYKNNANVNYPKILDLGNWCLGSRPSNSQRPDDEIEEAWPRDPTQSMVRGANAEPITDSPFQYTLKAAVTHWGDHGYGHYVCYRQHPFRTADEGNGDVTTDEETGKQSDSQNFEGIEEVERKEEPTSEQWWYLSDTSVHEVADHEALSQQNVFMLFYERLDPEDSLQSPPSTDEPVHSATSIPWSTVATPAEETVAIDNAADVVISKSEHSIDPSLVVPPSSPRLPLPGSGPALDPSVTPIEAEDGVSSHLSAPTPAAPIQSSDTSEAVQVEETEGSEAGTTNYDSEGAPSTELTSDDDVEMTDVSEGEDSPKGLAEVDAQCAPSSNSSPHTMRTAQDVRRMGSNRGRRSLPMVNPL